MINFAKRNIIIYLRDRTSVFFSFLAVFLIIGLYALFLRDAWTSDFKGMPEAQIMMDSWIVAGLLAVTAVTTSMGSAAQIIDDKALKIRKDFFSTPIRRSSLISGYLLSTFSVGMMMSIIMLIMTEIYIKSFGGEFLQLPQILKVSGMMIISAFNGVALVSMIVNLLSTQSAFGTASTIIGTLIGFLTGIYMPIGALPTSVQKIISIFPPAHSASIFRKIFMEKPMQIVFQGAPARVAAETRRFFGIDLYWNEQMISPWFSVTYLLISGFIFLIIGILISSRKTR